MGTIGGGWWQVAGAIGSAMMGLGWATVGLAQIVPDSTLPVNSTVLPGCTSCVIEGGTERGVNLYHSFREFSIPTGGSAWFNNSPQIQAILTRVTGSSLSNIDGLLKTNGTANLFFLNPNGILFGPNARLAVGGSFVASTASSWRLPDGSEFSAIAPNEPPLLTVNVPIGLQPGRIPAGSTITNRGNLTTGQDLGLVGDRLELRGQLQAGGNLTLQASDTVQIRDSATEPFVAKAGGALRVQGNQQVDIFALHHPNSRLVSGGEMVLRSATPVIGDAHYWSYGNFRIEQLNGNLGELQSPNDPVIRSLGDVSFNSYFGASLHIIAAGKVEIPGFINITGADPSNGLMETVRLSDGTVVAINGKTEPTLDIRAGVRAEAIDDPGIRAGNEFFFPNPTLTVNPSSADIQLGNIQFSDAFFTTTLTGQVLITNQYQPNLVLAGNIRLLASTAGNVVNIGSASQGGNVAIDSRGSVILNGTIDASARFSPAGIFSGNGGIVRILADNDITLASGSAIGSLGALGGDITLTSGGTLAMTNSLVSNRSYAQTSGLKGGNLTITANEFSMLNSGLQTSTYGRANAGDVIINVTNAMTMTGADASNSGIQSNVESGAVANGGNVNITARSLILNGAQIQTIVRRSLETSPGVIAPAGQGNAGNINLNIQDDITLGGINTGNGRFIPSQITSQLDFGTTGQAGNISIQQARSLTLTNGAVLNSSTAGQGNAGNVSINVKGDISLDGFAINSSGVQSSGIQSNIEFGAVGNGGNIEINAENVSLTNGAQIQTIVRQTFLGVNGTILLPAGRGTAGNVQVNVRNAVTLDGTGTVEFNGQTTSFPSQIVSAFDLGATDGKAGDISVEAQSLSITNGARLNSSTFGQGNAGSIRVNVRDGVIVSGVGNGRLGSGILSDVGQFSTGNGGDIAITARSLSLQDGGLLSSSVAGQGNAGNISVNTLGNITIAGVNSNSGLQGELSGIGTIVARGAKGQGGDITLKANSLVAVDGGFITTATYGQPGVDGRSGAGNIAVTVSESITLRSGAQLRSDTYGEGDAGNITLQAGGNISLDGTTLTRGREISSGVFSTVNRDSSLGETIGVGAGGDIHVSARNLFISNRATINAFTYGVGDAGNISVQVAEDIVLSNASYIDGTVVAGGVGAGGEIDLQSRTLTLTDGAQVAAVVARTRQGLPGGQGRGGNIRITAFDSVTLSGISDSGFSSGVLTLSERGASGTAGDIFVNTRDFRVSDGAIAVASTFNDGNAGTITINADRFTARNGGQVVTNTRGSGRAGNIVLNVRDSLVIEGSDPNAGDRATRINQYLQTPGVSDRFDDVIVNVGSASGLFANTAAGSSGNGGSIFIAPNTASRSVTIRDGAGIFVDSQGSGIGGNITVDAGRMELRDQGSITAETTSTQGGNISLNVQDLLLLRRHSLISATAGTAQAGGDGGNIIITTPFIIGVLGENSDITANAFTGRGGNINITSNAIYGLQFQPQLTPFSDITASSQFGLNGTVTLNLLNVDPSRGFISLPVDLTDPTTQLDTRCQPGSRGYASSYIETGRGGVPQNPEDPLIDETVTVGWAEARTGRRTEEGRRRTEERNWEDRGQTRSPETEIIEAQAIGRDRQGHLWLVAKTNQPKQFVPPECQAGGR